MYTKKVTYFYNTCISCGEDIITLKDLTDLWCPLCGDKQVIESVDDISTPEIIKSKKHKIQEDETTERICNNGGWFNPITNKCMGSGIGFRKHS